MCKIFVFVKLISFLCVIAGLKTVHGNPVSSFLQDNGNNIQLPTSKNQSVNRTQNGSRLYNITSNELKTDAIHATTNIIKTVTSSIHVSLPTTHTGGNLLDAGFEGSKTNVSNISTTVRTPLSTPEPTNHITLIENYTTVSPSTPSNNKHHFNVKILAYILIPVGCLVAIVVSYCVVRHVQKVRRKRRLERELVHQYSYPNSEADDSEEQNIGDLESIVNAQFVAYSDRTDKNLYEDSEVNLAFEESSKLVVQEPTPSPPEELEVSTSFTS